MHHDQGGLSCECKVAFTFEKSILAIQILTYFKKRKHLTKLSTYS